nr:M20 family metallopeptidase [uncultured Blautia sp.]
MKTQIGGYMNIQDYTEELIELRHHFHQHPELALQEVETSAYIRRYLEKLGYEIKPVEPTGLIAELPCLRDRKKVIVLRAEMDALPIQEQTGLSYASVNEGCMHACGHDFILASALILAKIVAEESEKFPVRIRFLFEPAEEIGEGAKRMLQAGALENPKADAFLMFHYAADMTLGMAVHQGQASSMINSMQIHVHGKSSHWCEADKGIDAIYAAAQVVNTIHDLNENFGKQHPDAGKYIIGTGTIHGGEYTNIIADHVVLNGNIRAVHEETYMALEQELEKYLQKIEQKTGTQIRMEFPKDPVYAFANDDELVWTAKAVGEEIFGDKFVLEGEDELFLSGDNAYRYFKETRGLFSVFLAGIPGEEHPLHHPKFQLDERILPYSVEALYKIIMELSL